MPTPIDSSFQCPNSVQSTGQTIVFDFSSSNELECLPDLYGMTENLFIKYTSSSSGVDCDTRDVDEYEDGSRRMFKLAISKPTTTTTPSPEPTTTTTPELTTTTTPEPTTTPPNTNQQTTTPQPITTPVALCDVGMSFPASDQDFTFFDNQRFRSVEAAKDLSLAQCSESCLNYVSDTDGGRCYFFEHFDVTKTECTFVDCYTQNECFMAIEQISPSVACTFQPNQFNLVDLCQYLIYDNPDYNYPNIIYYNPAIMQCPMAAAQLQY